MERSGHWRRPVGWAVLAVACLACVAAALVYRGQAQQARTELAAIRDLASRAPERPAAPVEAVRPTAPAVAPSVAPAVDLKAASEIAGLKSRILELDQALQARRPEPRPRREGATNQPPDASRFRRGPQVWMDELKQSDPARYEEIIQRRDEARQKVQTAFEEKTAFVVDRGQAVAEEEQPVYQQMVQLLDDTQRLSEQLRAEDLSWERRREIMHTLRENMTALEPLLLAERDREWNSLGQQLGYDEEDARAFSEYLNGIIDVTTTRNLIPDMRGGPFGGFAGPRNATTSSVPATLVR